MPDVSWGRGPLYRRLEKFDFFPIFEVAGPRYRLANMFFEPFSACYDWWKLQPCRALSLIWRALGGSDKKHTVGFRLDFRDNSSEIPSQACWVNSGAVHFLCLEFLPQGPNGRGALPVPNIGLLRQAALIK